ncbi:MAG: chemotaxis protein CheB, partial [bacterium]|nr:chemotaxis protein CheB [bacterium]
VTVDSLIMGASDYVSKAARSQSQEQARQYLSDQLMPKVMALIPRARRRKKPAAKVKATPPTKRRVARRAGVKPIEVVAIGASTGGPNALALMLKPIPARFDVPILIVQHMPENFTQYLAKRLDAKSPVRVVEARKGMCLEPGHAYVAPGNQHLEVVRENDEFELRTHQGPLVNSCRPSVDVLFMSVAKAYGGAVLGVVLTGMGQDGLHGSQQMTSVGGSVIVQDQATSVVWGMPGHVAEADLADAILPIEEVGDEVLQRVKDSRV